jgi:competence protein ComX
MEQIEVILKNIEPIIMNCRKKTRIPSWEIADYMQEGMIIALELYNDLARHTPEREVNFYVFFKVKYSCFLIDVFRKSQALKRSFDQLDYVELSVSYDISDHTQKVAENVMYDLLDDEIRRFLTVEELETFEALKRGEKVDRNKKYRLKKKILTYIIKFW